MFRYKKSIPVSYEWQGYIYFTSRLYWELPKRTQEKSLNLCSAAGKEIYQAAIHKFRIFSCVRFGNSQ